MLAGPPPRLQTLPETAAAAGKSEAEAEALLAACREKLFAAREKRPRPHRDDKVGAPFQIAPPLVQGSQACGSTCTPSPPRHSCSLCQAIVHPKIPA